jgi:hypothetical protein
MKAGRSRPAIRGSIPAEPAPASGAPAVRTARPRIARSYGAGFTVSAGVSGMGSSGAGMPAGSRR